MPAPEFTVKFEWHAPDMAFAAVFLRDGRPWFLDGALVGMGMTRQDALTDLLGVARHLVIRGGNFLTEGLLSLADRQWLFALLGQGPGDEGLYAAWHVAGGMA